MGVKRERGKPVLYAELKQKSSFNLTATAKNVLIAEAKRRNSTMSEVLETLLRNLSDSDLESVLEGKKVGE